MKRALLYDACRRLGTRFPTLFLGLDLNELSLESLEADPVFEGVLTGWESEAFTTFTCPVSQHWMPLDVPSWLESQGAKDLVLEVPGGRLTPEAGRDMLELVTQPGRPLHTFSHLRGMIRHLEGLDLGLGLTFCNSRPDYGPCHPPLVALKSRRYHGLIAAARLTKGERGVELFKRNFATRAALHTHWSGFDEATRLRVFNLLTRLAPFLESAVGPLFGAPRRRGSEVWGNPDDPRTQWTPTEYLPDLREFESWDHVMETLGSITHFLDANDEPDLVTTGITSWLMKCIWWVVRWSRYDTIECRFNSSMPLEGVEIAVILTMVVIRAAVLSLPVRSVSRAEWRAEF